MTSAEIDRRLTEIDRRRMRLVADFLALGVPTETQIQKQVRAVAALNDEEDRLLAEYMAARGIEDRSKETPCRRRS